MKACESSVDDFLSSNKTQFVIPVYQRNYDWTFGQCKQLIDDIIEVGANKKMNAHFIGSIVYDMPSQKWGLILNRNQFRIKSFVCV